MARARTATSEVGLASATRPATRRNASPLPRPAMRGFHAAIRDSSAAGSDPPHEGLTVRCARTVSSPRAAASRSEEHTSELQSRGHLVCRLLLEKKKKKQKQQTHAQIKKKAV